MRQSLASTEGWEVQRAAYGIRVLYQDHDSGFVKIRLEAEVEAPVFDLIALLREIGLWGTWMPSFAGVGLSGSRQLGQTSDINFCFHLDVNLPWPFSNRSCTLAVDGVDCMHTEDAPQQVVVLLDTRYAQSNCPEPIDKLRGVNRPVDLWDSGVIITPAEVANTTFTYVQLIAVIDPKMHVPRTLVNLAVRNLCFLIMVQIRRAVAVTRSPAHLAITSDPSNRFYAFIRRRMAENLPNEFALISPVAAVAVAAPQRRQDEGCFSMCCGIRSYTSPRETLSPAVVTSQGGPNDESISLVALHSPFLPTHGWKCMPERTHVLLMSVLMVLGAWWMFQSGSLSTS